MEKFKRMRKFEEERAAKKKKEYEFISFHGFSENEEDKDIDVEKII